MNMRARATGTPAATQRSQNPDTISISDVPARPAWVSHADNSAKTASFMPPLYSHAVWFWHQAEGIRSDTGLSGSTGWHNSVRARMYFKPAPGDDTSLRVLEVKKNNYGPVSESIVLRWRDGVYVVEPGVGTLDRLAAEAEIDHLFLKLLRRSPSRVATCRTRPA